MLAPERAVGVAGGDAPNVGGRPSRDVAATGRPAGGRPCKHRVRRVATLAMTLVCLLTAATNAVGGAGDPICTIDGYAASVRSDAARAATDFADGERLTRDYLAGSLAAMTESRQSGGPALRRSADDIVAGYRLSSLYRSNRHIEEMIQEDATIIETMYGEAARIFAGNGPRDESDGDFIFSQVLLILRVVLPDSVAMPDEGASCSWEKAIDAAEAPVLALRPAQAAAAGAISGSSDRRAGKPQAPDVPAVAPVPTESNAAEAQRPLTPGERADDFVADLENLKLLAKAADVLIASFRQDVVDYDGGVTMLGTTFNRASRDPRERLLAKLWSVIYREVPLRDARFRNEMRAMRFMTDMQES